MRRTIPIALIATLAAASVAFAATGHATKPRTASLAQAVQRTMDVRKQRYAVDLQILKGTTPHVLHAHAAVAPGTVSVDLQLGATKLGKLVIPGPDSGALIEGPFLYERAPSGLVVLGKVRWLRVNIAELSSGSDAVQAVHALTAMPLLRVLGEAHARALAPNASVFRGTVAYDDPIVDDALRPLTAGLQFRDLRVTAWIGPGGLVRRVKITGETPDHRTTLLIRARLYGFGLPVHVTPPSEGTFLDQSLLQLSN